MRVHDATTPDVLHVLHLIHIPDMIFGLFVSASARLHPGSVNHINVCRIIGKSSTLWLARLPHRHCLVRMKTLCDDCERELRERE